MPKKNALSATVAFAVPAEVHLLDLAGPAHIFYEAQQNDAPLQLAFVGLQAEHPEAISSAGLAFSALNAFESLQLGADDLLFIPGIDFTMLADIGFLASIRPFLRWVRQQYDNGAALCSVCTGTFLLAETGLLNGRQCTTHWKYSREFQQRYPKADLLRNRLFVESDGLYSSAGVASGIDLALFLLEKRYGSRFAVAIAREVVLYFRRGQEDPQLSIFLQYRNHLDDRIHAVQDYLAQRLDRKNPISELAALVHTSPRHLSRLFKQTTGVTIGQYQEKLRVEHALQLLGKGHSVDQVAGACGLQSTNRLRSLLKKHAGVLPSDLQQLS